MRDINQQHADYGRGREKDDCCYQPRKVFSHHQHFAAHRAQKVEVQTSVNNVAAEEIHEYPGTAKENYCAQNESAIENGKDHVVLSEVLPLTPWWREGSKQDQRDYREQGQQVEQNRTPAEKAFFNLEPEDRTHLPEPARPRQRTLVDFLTWRDFYS